MFYEGGGVEGGREREREEREERHVDLELQYIDQVSSYLSTGYDTIDQSSSFEMALLSMGCLVSFCFICVCCSVVTCNNYVIICSLCFSIILFCT